jgi:hypothetical protein
MRLRVFLASIAALSVLLPTSSAFASPGTHPPTAWAARSYHRCATFRDRDSPYGSPGEDEYGVYILKGHVACVAAIKIQTAVFAGKAEGLTGLHAAYSFYRGWYCDGQMGGYTCQNALEHASRSFAVLACAAPDIRCPVDDSDLGPA